MTPSVSVILSTHDRPAALARALGSVLAQTHRPAEIIIVNDGAQDVPVPPGLPAQAAEAGVPLRTIRLAGPSLTASRNAGLGAGRGDVLLLMDDDHELPPDYLARLAALYRADTDGRVHAIGGTVTEPRAAEPGAIPMQIGTSSQPCGPEAPHQTHRIWDLLMRASGHLRWRPRRCVARHVRLPGALREALKPATCMTGGTISLRREVARGIRFDEGLGGYGLGEDRDFSFRATRRFAVFTAPSLQMTHHREQAHRCEPAEFGRMIVEHYVRIASRSLEAGAGKWLLVVWNLAGLMLAHAAHSLLGDRKRHRGILRGMVRGLGGIARAALARIAKGIARGGSTLPARRDRPHCRRVLMLLSRLEVGGAEKMALHLAGALPGRGIEAVVAAVYGPGTLSNAFARGALAVHEPLAAGRFDVRCSLRVAGLIRRYRIDALLVVDAVRNAMLCGVWGVRLSGRRVPTVLWCHASPGHDLPGGRMPGFVRRLRRMAARFDVIVPVARWQRKHLADLGIPRRRMCVIPNGVPLPPQAPTADEKQRARRELGLPQLDESAFLLVQVANYWPEKDPLWLLEALSLARQGDPGAPGPHLVLVGRGMDSPQVRAEVARLGLRAAVTMAGARDDVGRFLAAADAFVLASRHETFALSALEAMAAGLPMIVTDIPAFDGLVEDGVHCLLAKKCPAGDASALAGHIRRLAHDPQLAACLAAAARHRAERYSLDAFADRFARLLRAAVAAGQ